MSLDTALAAARLESATKVAPGVKKCVDYVSSSTLLPLFTPRSLAVNSQKTIIAIGGKIGGIPFLIANPPKQP